MFFYGWKHRVTQSNLFFYACSERLLNIPNDSLYIWQQFEEAYFLDLLAALQALEAHLTSSSESSITSSGVS